MAVFKPRLTEVILATVKGSLGRVRQSPQLSGYVLQKAILSVYEKKKLFPEGLYASLPAVSDWALRCGAILKKCVCSLVHLQIPKWSKMVLKSNFMTHTVVVNFIFYHRPRYRSSADLQRGPRVRNAKHFSRWNMLLVKWDGPIQNHLHRILGLKDCIFQLVQHMNASTMIPLACMASYSIYIYIYMTRTARSFHNMHTLKIWPSFQTIPSSQRGRLCRTWPALVLRGCLLQAQRCYGLPNKSNCWKFLPKKMMWKEPRNHPWGLWGSMKRELHQKKHLYRVRVLRVRLIRQWNWFCRRQKIDALPLHMDMTTKKIAHHVKH